MCLKNQSIVHRLNCNFCKKYYKRDIVVKEVKTTECYTEKEIKEEYEYHKKCYDSNPNIFIKIYDFWMEETKRGILNDYLYPRSLGLFVLEYMNSLSLKEYFDNYLNNSLDSDETEVYNTQKINISSLIFTILYIINYLHNELNICHGDISTNNIFINYVGEHYTEQLLEYNNKQYRIPTNGFHIKIGDFSVTDKISFKKTIYIKRDYIVLCNMYILKQNWKYLTDINTFHEILNFIEENIIEYFGKDKHFYTNNKKFWNCKSKYIDESVLYYIYPKQLLNKYIELYL